MDWNSGSRIYPVTTTSTKSGSGTTGIRAAGVRIQTSRRLTRSAANRRKRKYRVVLGCAVELYERVLEVRGEESCQSIAKPPCQTPRSNVGKLNLTRHFLLVLDQDIELSRQSFVVALDVELEI